MSALSRYRITSGILGGLVAILIFSMPWAAAAALSSPLQYGDRGPQVAELQRALAALGYFDHEITENFRSVTQDAVIQFQKAYNISPTTGYFGPLTLAKLKSGTDVANGVVVGATTPAPFPNPTANIVPSPSNSPSLYVDSGSSWSTSATHVMNLAVSGIDLLLTFRPEQLNTTSLKDNFMLLGLFRYIADGTKDNKEKNRSGEGSRYLTNALSANRGYGHHKFTSIPWTLDWMDCDDQRVARDDLVKQIEDAYKENNNIKINIVTHSHGTIIAYNALKELEKSPDIQINNFLSMGTIIGPLNGQDSMCLSTGPFTRPKNVTNWVNVHSDEDGLSRSVQIADKNISLPLSPDFLARNLVSTVAQPAFNLEEGHGRYFNDKTLALSIIQCTGEGKCLWGQNPSPVVPAPAPPAPVPTPTPPAPTPAPAACSFTRDLNQGVSGSDVLCLQRYLNSSGFVIAASGPGSPGNETNYYGPLMSKAVSKWQIANNISPAPGNFGAISRAKFSAASVPSSAPTSVPTPTPTIPKPESKTTQSGPEPTKKHVPISANRELVVELFNVDDRLSLKLNGQLAGQVGYLQKKSFDLSKSLTQGQNTLALELSNNIGAGWTYGFRIIADGVPVVEQSCGTVSVFGCNDNDQSAGLVFVDTYTVAKGSTGETTPIPPTPFVPTAIVNPQLLNTPVSAPKGTTFFFQGTYFTPRGGITEFITKPNGESYTLLHYQADDNGRYSKNYDSSTASIFGTYSIYWIDDATGKRSNTVSETILAGNAPLIQTSNSELLQYKNFDLVVHQIRKTDGLEVPASYQYRDGKGLLLIDMEWLINEAKQSGWKYEIVPTGQ